MVSVESLFSKARLIFNELETGLKIDLTEAIIVIDQAIEAVEKNMLFSKNETLDDIPTQYLKVFSNLILLYIRVLIVL